MKKVADFGNTGGGDPDQLRQRPASARARSLNSGAARRYLATVVLAIESQTAMHTNDSHPARIFTGGVVYFALVFGAGFILGAIRVPILVPRLGERVSELVEMPFMLVAVLLAARFVVRRFSLPAGTSSTLLVGLLALGLLLVAEFLLAVAIQDRSIGAYIASRDPISGTVYLAMLVLFALMPLILARTCLARGRDAA